MKAAVLRHGSFHIEEVPTPEPRPGEVLVHVGGAGVCHSDLDLRDTITRTTPDDGRILGHENAGWIAALGAPTPTFRVGDPVIVFGGWGCGDCALCLSGDEQLCDITRWCGIGPPGGFAEYLLVPNIRHLVPAPDLDPRIAAPLADAALTPYSAIKRIRAKLTPGTVAVVIGVGGLGQFAVQILRVLTPAIIIAVDQDADHRSVATEMGAHYTFDPRDGDLREHVDAVSGGLGADAVIDLVGTDATMAEAVKMLAHRGSLVLVGLGGGQVPFSFRGIPAGSTLTTSNWGSRDELQEVVALHRSGTLACRVEHAPLEDINNIFGRLADGGITGRAVLTP